MDRSVGPARKAPTCPIHSSSLATRSMSMTSLWFESQHRERQSILSPSPRIFHRATGKPHRIPNAEGPNHTDSAHRVMVCVPGSHSHGFPFPYPLALFARGCGPSASRRHRSALPGRARGPSRHFLSLRGQERHAQCRTVIMGTGTVGDAVQKSPVDLCTIHCSNGIEPTQQYSRYSMQRHGADCGPSALTRIRRDTTRAWGKSVLRRP